MTTRQARMLNRQKRAQNEAWTAVAIALLLVSLLAVKVAVNICFAHALAQHNEEIAQ